MNNYIKVLRDIKKGKMPLVKDWDLQDVIDLNMFVFKLNHGYSFDIYNPKTFSEKIQWYKFFYNRDDFAQITDKILFKDYITSRLGEGYVVPMYGAWDDIDKLEIDWDTSKLPETFILKSNLQGNSLCIKKIDRKTQTDFKLMKDELATWFDPKNTLLNSCDWRFYNSKPMIFAEQYLEDEYGELRDYKFFCFEGKPLYFKVDYNRFSHHNATYFNDKMEMLDVVESVCPPSYDTPIMLPSNISEMFSIAEKVSKDFPFIRVDFYSVRGSLYLAEMTFNPAGGMVPYTPTSFNEEMGRLFKLPI